MQQIWSNQYLYAFPSFPVINKVLKRSPVPSKKNVDCSSHMAVSSMVSNPSDFISIGYKKSLGLLKLLVWFRYRTIGCHMSAISAYHVYVDNKPVGQHPHVCALLKGMLH